jgi:nucleoside-diphosphate-sugar epimerase
MKVIVAGAAGLVGRYTAIELNANGHDVTGIDTAQAPTGGPPVREVDLGDAKSLEQVFAGADAVIHLARIRFPYTSAGYDAARRVWLKPDAIGDAKRFNDNVAMTMNVLAAALATGVKRLVMGSSLAIYGLYYPSQPVAPEYVPIDESHPRRPDDPYGLTKLVDEELAAGFARKGVMQIASLRFPGVASEDHGLFLTQQTTERRGTGGLWSYLDVRDAAIACRRAVEAEFDGHESFNVCAPVIVLAADTRDLLRQHLPEVTDIRTSADGNWAGYDTRKAEARLGFRARHLFCGRA